MHFKSVQTCFILLFFLCAYLLNVKSYAETALDKPMRHNSSVESRVPTDTNPSWRTAENFNQSDDRRLETCKSRLERTKLQTYHDSGLYDKEIKAVATKARQYITRQAKLNQQSSHPQKLAIVLDIDETSLSYYHYMATKHFCYNKTDANHQLLIGNAPAIKPILALYQRALKNKIAVFFVTARPAMAYEATIRNLRSAGYKIWAGFYIRPNSYHETSYTPYKAKTRASITNQGYTIIANIGDQYSDLNGGYAQKTFKLPNPYYYLP